MANALNEMGGGGVYRYQIIHGEIVHVLAGSEESGAVTDHCRL